MAKNADRKQNKPAAAVKATGKGKKEREPVNRKERRELGKTRAAKKAAGAKSAPPVHEPVGLTLAQLEASGLTTTKQSAGPTFEQALLEVIADQARQFESTEPVSLPATLNPEVRIFISGQTYTLADYEAVEEPFGSTASRKVVAAEIHSLLKKTGLIFNAYRESGTIAAQLAAGETFEKEPEDSPLKLQLAEVVLTDDPAAVGDFLEEVWGRVVELQLIAGSFEPESELEKSARLGLVDEATADRLKRAVTEEAIRLDLSQRLAGLTVSATTPTAEVDETFAVIIAEAAQAAKVQRRERATFRQTLSQRLRGRKEREGQRVSSKSSEESGDEEFVQFLASHREEPGAKQALLALHLEAEIAAAEKRWADLKSRLAAGASHPETTVAQNATAMKDLLGALAQIGALHQQLEALG